MNYELFGLSDRLEILLSKDAACKEQEDLKETSLEAEIKRTYRALLQQACPLHQDQVRSYIQLHQQGLEQMLSRIAEHQDCQHTRKEETQVKDLSLLNAFKQEILNLLLQLKMNFPKAFRHTNPLPITLIHPFRARSGKSIQQVTSILSDKGLHPEILSAFTTMLDALINPENPISYASQEFMDHFFTTLLLKTASFGTYEEPLTLILTLIALNLNHPTCYAFCGQYFQSEISKCEHRPNQYRTLYVIRKTIDQARATSARPYDANYPPIGQALLSFIDAELKHLESINQIAADSSTVVYWKTATKST
ncbi:hypothetical protein EV200_104274 [Pedobacter psychrotolerans]|uniref:Uncharacterized protein n=1 Tax=Pedobacter psychrotolerans TaxID=1843235 RepID=A0A4R2HCA6_9SPHI|nr:hypothetical protein [Pedobacter psychrotolerans]TCO25237.1 hypothetical protein EV200_104274 [Pedobacter psychrotolerans]GGE47010.1 hypothetical protein GCM10011413_11430 [Pedobacter psychrotolerans]